MTIDETARALYAAHFDYPLDELWFWDAPWFLAERIRWQDFAERFLSVRSN